MKALVTRQGSVRGMPRDIGGSSVSNIPIDAEDLDAEDPDEEEPDAEDSDGVREPAGGLSIPSPHASTACRREGRLTFDNLL